MGETLGLTLRRCFMEGGTAGVCEREVGVWTVEGEGLASDALAGPSRALPWVLWPEGAVLTRLSSSPGAPLSTPMLRVTRDSSLGGA